MQQKPPSVVLTTNVAKITNVLKAFAKGCGGKVYSGNQMKCVAKNVAVFGFLYGQMEVLLRSFDYEYWHIDNGYIGRSRKGTMCGYYRITHDGLYYDGSRERDWKRFNKFKIRLKDWRKDGSRIVLVPPSPYVSKVLNLSSWTNDVHNELSKFTDRKIIVSTKASPIRLNNNDIWCVVTCSSNILVDSLIEGIPVITTHFTKIGSLAEIENPPMNRNILASLAYEQWTVKQMESGQAWRELNE